MANEPPDKPDKDDLDPAADKDDRDDKDRGRRRSLEGLIPDLVRKTITTGIGAVFAGEERLREMASELPKDVRDRVMSSASNTKDEILKIIGRETREFLEKLNLQQEMAKLLTQLSLEVKTEIRFIPNDEAVSGVKPDIKRKFAIKRVREDGTTEDLDPPPEEGEEAAATSGKS